MSKYFQFIRFKPSACRRLFRRLAAVPAALALLFAWMPAARAEDTLYPLGACSDEVLRAETRLCDLGYDTCVVNGRWDQADADALAAFAAANSVSTASGANTVALEKALFSAGAVPAAQSAHSVFATGAGGFVLTYGSLMPWSEAKTKLQIDTSYNIASCYSGITLHMVCVSLGAHAKFRPELDWDNATLRGFFSSASSSEKQPIVVTIDGVLVAASIQQAAPGADGDALPVYSVFFHDSLTGINGIPDAEHESVISIAANQP